MFPIDQLEAEGIIGPAVLWSPSLPSGTEGLAIVDSAPHVVIDRDPRGDKANALNDLSATAFAALTSRPGLGRLMPGSMGLPESSRPLPRFRALLKESVEDASPLGLVAGVVAGACYGRDS